MIQGGADPVSAIAGAISSVSDLANNSIDLLFGGRRRREAKLPQWLSRRDFQQTDNTPLFVALGLMILIVVILLLIARKN
ncbi:MAG: hypothetical protein AAFY48_08800 [Bacteroidota bacterium]